MATPLRTRKDSGGVHLAVAYEASVFKKSCGTKREYCEILRVVRVETSLFVVGEIRSYLRVRDDERGVFFSRLLNYLWLTSPFVAGAAADAVAGAVAVARFIKRRTHPKDMLAGLPFTLLGLGDTNYDKFW